MALPPNKPPSTDEENEDEGGDEQQRTLLSDIDQMSPQELADYLYALAEEIIASPEEYKVKLGIKELDISELDNIDLNTPAGRRKLAALFRLLAEQVLKGKEVYQSTVKDKSQQKQGKGR